MSIDQDISRAAQVGFVDNQIEARGALQPVLVTHQHDETILEAIENELQDCNSFTIAVAFVTLSGLIDLKSVFADLAAHNIHLKSNHFSLNRAD